MKPDTYYRDHWLDVDPERVGLYEEMFRWRPEMAPMLEPAELGEGQVIVDYGCGPGMLALELARRVGPSGHVHGVDINTLFLERAQEHARIAVQEAKRINNREDPYSAIGGKSVGNGAGGGFAPPPPPAVEVLTDGAQFAEGAPPMEE